MVTSTPISHNQLKKTVLASALTAALGISTSTTADQISGSFNALFTLVTPTGAPNFNTDADFRTPVSGTFSYDIATGAGTMSIVPFSFFGSGAATASAVSFQTIGDGSGGPGTLMAAQMGFNWNGNFMIPVTDVFDAAGFLSNLPAPASTVSVTISPNCTGCSTSDTPDVSFTAFGGVNGNSIGAVPIAMTTFNTAGTTLNNLFPLSTDGIAGSPMTTAPFPGQNAAFDFTTILIDTYVDQTSPLVTLSNSNVTVNQGTAFDPLNPGVTVTAVDNVDGTLNLTTDCTITNPVDVNTPGNYSVTYDCQDAAGNTNSASGAVNPVATLTVTVQSAGAPLITLIGANPLAWEAATPYNDPGATCVDNNGTGANIPVGANFSLDTSALNVNTIGSQTVTWNCTGATATTSLPRTVDVQDTTPPVVTLTPACGTGASAISQVADGTDPTPVATAIDALDGDISNAVVVTGGPVVPSPVFGSSLSQTFNLRFSSTDANNNLGFADCGIVLGNPNPVATLNGNATVVLDPGQGFTDPLATCADFLDGTLPDATPDMVIDTTTPNGSYTITYTCTNSASNVGTATRTVLVGTAFSAASDSGSRFTMINPSGDFVGGATDIFASWDGSLYTTNNPATQIPNLFMNSAQPQPFFGFPWTAHDIRAFGPGNYSITTSRGNTLNMNVGEDQIGAHMLFDWNGNFDIDVALVWDINAVFAGAPGQADSGAKGKTFTLAVADSDGDGIPGIPMADGPFEGFNANFNIILTPQFALPDATASAAQGSNNPASVIAPVSTPVVITATVDPNVNGAYSYAGPFTYDWSTSDAALLAVDDDNTNSATYNFNPSTLPMGGVTARVKVTDSASGLTNTVEIRLRIAQAGTSVTAVADTDGDGIIDSDDGIDNTANPTSQQVTAGSVISASDVATSSAGTLTLGDMALAIGANTGIYKMGLSDTDISVVDNGVAGSCVGGCFSFKVTGLTPGAAVDVVLPLSTPIPANAGVRKFVNNQWREFETTGGNAIMSAPLTSGDCTQLTGSDFVAGVVEGNECLKLTIVDGGINDADGLANGTVIDPSGVSGASTVTAAIPGTIQSPNTGGGCTLGNSASPASRFTEWWIIGGLLGLLVFTRHKRSKNS